MSKPPTQPKSIGIVSLVCLVIGNMIGSGVYISTSYALDALQDARLVLLAWAIGGAHALCGAIAYAALARRVRMSGGEYAFLSRYVHPAIGVMAGWISLLAGFTAPIAVAALVFGEYVCETPQASIGSRSVATAWILMCAVFHGINLRTGTWVNNGVIFLKFVGFGIFAIVCVRFLLSVDAQPGSAPFVPALDRSMFATDYFGELMQPGILLVILVQLFFISLSYTGFNASIYLAGEMRDPPSEDPTSEGLADDRPASIVPRSMIVACLIVTCLYLGLNALFLACDTRESIVAGRDYFVSGVAYHVGGEGMRWIMRITIALSSATSVLAMMATGPRVYAQMARDGWFPKWFGAHADVPRVAILIQALLSAGLVWLASALELISYLGLTLTACGAIATSTLWIAYREMQARAPIRGWEHLALGLYILGAVALLGAAWLVKPIAFWCCLASFGSGIAIYFVYFGLGKRKPVA
jgi:amino acid transporter